MSADAFSRGSQTPVTPSKATLFYRAGSEMLCENIAKLVVDATSGSVYASSDATNAIAALNILARLSIAHVLRHRNVGKGKLL